jgi:hypothetical protein
VNVPGSFETPHVSEKRVDRRLKRFLIWSVLLLTAGYTFLDYWEYSRIEHEEPISWAQLAVGQGLAPAQYRIGVFFTANFIAHLTHLHFRHIFAGFDLICCGISLASIFFLLTRSQWFRESTQVGQWGQIFFALLLTQLYLGWTFWFQEPETMPALLVLALSALVCSGHLQVPRPMLALSLVLLAVLGATIRADDVVAFQSGMLMACIYVRERKSDDQNEDRAWLQPASLLAIIAAFAVEGFITRRLFPHAERSAPLFQLFANLHAVNGALAILCTIPPWVLTVWLAWRERLMLPLWLIGVTLASVIEFVLFLTFGMSEEVRIFLPFALVLIPLSAVLLYRWFTREPAGDTLAV